MDENFYKSLQRLFLYLAMHCRRHRLADLGIECLSEVQRRHVITATLDSFEREIELLRIEHEAATEAVHGETGASHERQPSKQHFQYQTR